MYFHLLHVLKYMSIITQNGMSALQLAVENRCTDVVVELVKNGANVNQMNVCHDPHTITCNLAHLHVQCHVFAACLFNRSSYCL